MSTIKEAREQAREALPRALARLVENRLGKSLAREADKDMIALRAAANAIVALLDAIEPPAKAYERCHDCACHIAPPCGSCENCKHADYPECTNGCQDCEEHDND